jgi:hypothetical protein
MQSGLPRLLLRNFKSKIKISTKLHTASIFKITSKPQTFRSTPLMAPKRSDHLKNDDSQPSPKRNDSNTRGMNEHNKRQVHENRMDRPPYSLSGDPEHQPFKTLYTGSCFCEKVAFEIGREKPLDAKFCHCPTCQRLHGAPFQWVNSPVPRAGKRRGMAD